MASDNIIDKRNETSNNHTSNKTSYQKRRTSKQLNTARILHERIATYDALFSRYTIEPTQENKEILDDYSLHLRNVSQLAQYLYDYINDNNLQDTLLAYSKIRKLITEELEVGTIIKADGLIRNSKTNPYEDIPASGFVIPIILPTEHIPTIKALLAETLVNDSVRILVPCNNMILIVETGNYTSEINTDLNNRIFKTITLFAFDNKMHIPYATRRNIAEYIIS